MEMRAAEVSNWRVFGGTAGEHHCFAAQIHGYTDCAGETKTVQCARRKPMLIILLVVILLLSVGSFPAWPYSRDWGYYPSGGLGLVVVILVILLLMGRI